MYATKIIWEKWKRFQIYFRYLKFHASKNAKSSFQQRSTASNSKIATFLFYCEFFFSYNFSKFFLLISSFPLCKLAYFPLLNILLKHCSDRFILEFFLVNLTSSKDCNAAYELRVDNHQAYECSEYVNSGEFVAYIQLVYSGFTKSRRECSLFPFFNAKYSY